MRKAFRLPLAFGGVLTALMLAVVLISHPAEGAEVNDVLTARVKQNSYEIINKTGTAEGQDRRFIIRVSNTDLLNNDADIVVDLDGSRFESIEQTLKTGDSGCVDQHRAIVVPRQLSGDIGSKKLDKFKSQAEDMFNGRSVTVEFVFVLRTSFSPSNCPELAGKFNESNGRTQQTTTSDVNTTASKIKVSERAKQVNNSLGDLVSGKLNNASSAFASQSPWLDKLSDEDKKAAGCATIGGSVSCDMQAKNRLFQQMVNTCVDNINKSFTDDTGASSSSPKDKLAECIAKNTYRNATPIQKADISDSLKDLSWGDITQRIQAGEQAADDILSAPVDEEDSKTTCVIDGLGWIVCPAMNFIAQLNDAVFGIISKFLTVNVKVLDTSNPTFEAWKMFRDIANTAFVVIFLAVVFSQITSAGISNYGIKRILPRLIIGAILINSSFVISQLAVDLSNILGNTLYDFLTGLAGRSLDATGSSATWVEQFGAILAGGATVAGAVALVGAALYGLVAIGLAGSLMFLLSALITLLILIGRQAGVILLVAISPVAFAAWILPNTENLFKKWWKMLTGLLLVFPMVALLFGSGSFAASIIQGSDTGDFLMQIAALTISALPLIATPSLLKNSMNAIEGLGGKISALAGRTGAARNKLASERLKTSGLGQRVGNFANNLQRNRNKRIAQRRANSQFDRSRLGRALGLDKGSYAAQHAVDKANDEESEQILAYQYAGREHEALNSNNAHVQAAAAKHLAEKGEYGAQKMAEFIRSGGQIKSMAAANAFSSVKGVHAGVADFGTQAVKYLAQNPNGSYGLDAGTAGDEFRAMTSQAVGKLSDEVVAKQGIDSIKNAFVPGDSAAIARAKSLMGNDRLRSTMSAEVKSHLDSIIMPNNNASVNSNDSKNNSKSNVSGKGWGA